MLKIVSWNMQHKQDSWKFLVKEHADADLALLQEACTPVPMAKASFNVGDGPWVLKRASGARAIVGLGDGVKIERFQEEPIRELVPILQERKHSIAHALVTVGDRQVLLASVEMYDDLACYLPQIMEAVRTVVGFDGPTIVGGDINTQRSSNSPVFRDMAAIGLPMVGPVAPNGGPTPTKFSKPHKQGPADAKWQLDYVFASRDLKESMRVAALNDPDQWGPSDHCRILIELP